MTSQIKEAVRDRYGAVARSGLSSEDAGAARVAQAFGYSADELSSIPANANMGLSCGNPTATAHLQPGEVVVDLGSGGGLDVFLAARKVAPTGRAIGIDMTRDMIERARRNAREANLTNVEFHLAEIESMPLDTGSVDCVISNCVLNLVPDKSRAFAEIFRILKPGGRLAVSDIALKQPLPPEVSGNILAYIGCVAGAIEIDDYRKQLVEAGFEDVLIVDQNADLSVYFSASSGGCQAPRDQADPLAMVQEGCCGPSATDPTIESLVSLMRRYNVNDFAASVKVFAIKPSG